MKWKIRKYLDDEYVGLLFTHNEIEWICKIRPLKRIFGIFFNIFVQTRTSNIEHQQMRVSKCAIH